MPVLLFGDYEWNKRVCGPDDAHDDKSFDIQLKAYDGKEFWKEETLSIPEGAQLWRVKDWSEVIRWIQQARGDGRIWVICECTWRSLSLIHMPIYIHLCLFLLPLVSIATCFIACASASLVFYIYRQGSEFGWGFGIIGATLLSTLIMLSILWSTTTKAKLAHLSKTYAGNRLLVQRVLSIGFVFYVLGTTYHGLSGGGRGRSREGKGKASGHHEEPERVAVCVYPIICFLSPTNIVLRQVDAIFYQRLSRILRIIIPGIRSKEALLLSMHSSLLVFRTAISLYVAALDGKYVIGVTTKL